MRPIRSTVLASALAVAALAPAGAGAAPPDCSKVPGLAELGLTKGACASTLALGTLSGSAYVANCKALEPGFAAQNGGRTYPYTFYGDVPSSELPPGWPKITAKNRAGCTAALRTYHGLFGG